MPTGGVMSARATPIKPANVEPDSSDRDWSCMMIQPENCSKFVAIDDCLANGQRLAATRRSRPQRPERSAK
jgi:hypothetical protein